MKKLINKHIVEIGNIDIFEQALDGLYSNRRAYNKTDGNIEKLLIDNLKNIISAYNKIYSQIPFPLCNIDTDLKYMCIKMCLMETEEYKYITELNAEGNKIPCLWVDSGLYVLVNGTNENDKASCIYFVNNTWKVVDNFKYCTFKNRITDYADDVGFKEFRWVTNQIRQGKSTDLFYKVFFKDVVKVCKSDINFKYEINNMMQFSSVPNQLNLADNKIIELETNNEYEIDIYTEKVKTTKEEVECWDLTGSSLKVSKRSKKTRIYNYIAYIKYSNDNLDEIDDIKDRNEKCEKRYFLNLFNTLCGIKIAEDDMKFCKYRGFKCDKAIVFEIKNRVFISDIENVTRLTEIAKCAKIYSYSTDNIYITRQTIVGNYTKDTIYSYNLINNTLRFCNIKYTKR